MPFINTKKAFSLSETDEKSIKNEKYTHCFAKSVALSSLLIPKKSIAKLNANSASIKYSALALTFDFLLTKVKHTRHSSAYG